MDFQWRRREVYPGLGLPLRHLAQESGNFYPSDIRGSPEGSFTELLPVREIAMMVIMDRLTDKLDWEKKVFNAEIVSKWRKEALDYSEEALWDEATGGKHINEIQPISPEQVRSWPIAEPIMTSETFDYVRRLRVWFKAIS